MAYDDTGYSVDSYQDEQQKIRDNFIKNISPNLHFDDQTLVARLANAMAFTNWIQNQKQQQVWLNQYAQFAKGVSLDYLAYNRGIYRQRSQQSTATVTITGSQAVFLEGGTTEFMTDDGIYFTLLEDTLLSDDGSGNFTATVQVVSDDYSSDTNVQAHAITVVADPLDGLDSLTNPEPATGGPDEETDDSLLARHLETNLANSGATDNGIRAALDGVTGLKDKYVDANSESTTNANGTPPHAIQVVSYGGSDQDIADAIRSSKAAGTETYGSVSVVSYDVGGHPETVYFNHATEVPIYFSIHVKPNEDWDTDSATADIVDRISQYINNNKMGQTVYVSSIYGAISGVTGVDSFTISLGKSAESVGQADIPMKITEVLVTNSVEVSVTADSTQELSRFIWKTSFPINVTMI